MHLSVARSLPWLAALSAVAACVSGVRPSSNATPLRDARTALRQTVDSLVDVPEFRNAHWGILIVDPGRGETLYSRNADKLFMPASNQKLLTGATALALLGPDFRWPTTFLASGPVRSGVLEGDLMVRGSGDPSVSAHAYRGDALAPLRSVADSLRAHGITRIRGRIVAAPSPFTDAPLGYGWSWSELDEPYSAGVDALFFNEGFSEIVVRGGARPGEPVTAVTRPLGAHPPLVVRAATVARAPAGAAPADSMAALPAIKVERDSARGAIVVNGTLAVGDSTALAVAYRDQPGAYLAALGEALRASGVSIEQARTDTTARLDSVATIMSLPLRDVLPLFEKPSQNQIGELLFKTLAVVKTGVGTADSAAQVVARQLVAWGVPPEGFAVRDGSGLSRHDYVSPRTLVRVLDVMRQSPDFKIFYDALPIAGVDGTTRNRMKGTAAAGNIHAKTGTLDKARSLSGYVTTADGRLLLFSILCNNYTVPTRRVDQVTDALGIRLATLQLRAE